MYPPAAEMKAFVDDRRRSQPQSAPEISRGDERSRTPSQVGQEAPFGQAQEVGSRSLIADAVGSLVRLERVLLGRMPNRMIQYGALTGVQPLRAAERAHPL